MPFQLLVSCAYRGGREGVTVKQKKVTLKRLNVRLTFGMVSSLISDSNSVSC